MKLYLKTTGNVIKLKCRKSLLFNLRKLLVWAQTNLIITGK